MTNSGNKVPIGWVAGTIGWAHDYAPKGSEWTPQNRLWKEFAPLKSWFRKEIIRQLRLNQKTSWKRIWKLTGLLEDRYRTEERRQAAFAFGRETYLYGEEVARKYQELCDVKFRNDGLV